MILFFDQMVLMTFVDFTVPSDSCPGRTARETPSKETDRLSGAERQFDYFARPPSEEFYLLFPV